MTDKTENLSCYILTCNSGKHLGSILAAIRNYVDDTVIIDSGSTDDTEAISHKFGARFISRKFDNFRDQRIFAIGQCKYRWVLCLDSDEIPDEVFGIYLSDLKNEGFTVGNDRPDAFRFKRHWFVLGKKVHAFYPISSPDYPIRLFNREKVGFVEDARHVHETISGARNIAILGGAVMHYSCESTADLLDKLNLYTSLAALDLKKRGATAGSIQVIVHPAGAWLKWYIAKGGWKDGRVGWLLGKYAFQYTRRKYLILSQYANPKSGKA